jgi:hypothetical protein
MTSWEQFQKMVCELFREIWQDPYAQEFGRQGQSQDGIDIVGCRRSNKNYEAVQATIKSPLTTRKIKKDYDASQDLDTKLDCFIIASTNRRDVELQKYALKLSGTGPYKCIILFWEDIVEKLADYDKIRKKYYPEYYFIKSLGNSSGKLIELNDETTRFVLLITMLPEEHAYYGGVLLICDLLSYSCQTYRLGDHWSRLVLDDYLKPVHQKCIGGNKYGAFLLSSWLNSFNSVDEILKIESESPSIYKLTKKQKTEFSKIMRELEEE